MKSAYDVPYYRTTIFSSFNNIVLKNSDCNYSFVIDCKDKNIIKSFNKIKIMFDNRKCSTKSISCKISVTNGKNIFNSFNWFNIIKKTDDNIVLNAMISIESYKIDNILNNITLFKNSSSLTITAKSIEYITNSIQNIKGVDVLKIYFPGITKGSNLINNINTESLSVYFLDSVICDEIFQDIKTKKMYIEFNKTDKQVIVSILENAIISTDSLMIKTDVDLKVDDIKNLPNLFFKEIKIIKG